MKDFQDVAALIKTPLQVLAQYETDSILLAERVPEREHGFLAEVIGDAAEGKIALG